MTDQEWIAYFDEHKDKFKWFIGAVSQWLPLKRARSARDRKQMTSIMNHVWFILPDNRFNIIENPKGWSEFLTLIEE